jgi:preprotein translocase subunit YajC
VAGKVDVGLLIILVIVGLLYVLFMVPARRRRQAHSSMQDSVDVGDEIITAGGLHGHVRSFDAGDNTVRVEIAPDVVVTLDRRAIAAVARETEVEVEAPEDEFQVTEDEDGGGTPEEPR